MMPRGTSPMMVNSGGEGYSAASNFYRPPAPGMSVPGSNAVPPQFVTPRIRAHQPLPAVAEGPVIAMEYGRFQQEHLLEQKKEVVLSYVTDPSDFYITLVGSGLKGILTKIQEELKKFFGDPHRSRGLEVGARVAVGMPCAALFSQDGQWYRAVVKATNTGVQNKVAVQFVDYGNEEIVATSSIKFLPDSFAKASPALAVHCGLKNAEPAQGSHWSQESKDLMENMLEEDLLCIFQTFVSARDAYEVELVNPSSEKGVPHDVLESLQKIGAAASPEPLPPPPGFSLLQASASAAPNYPHAAMAPASGFYVPGSVPTNLNRAPEPSPLSQPILTAPKLYQSTQSEVLGMPPLKIPAEKDEYLDVVVSYVEEGKRNVFVQMTQEADRLMLLSASLNKYCSSEVAMPLAEVIKPGVQLYQIAGTLCAAKYTADESWYRAVVVGASGPNWFQVYFVDYGNKEIVADKDMRELLSTFKEYPPQAIRVAIKGAERVSCQPLESAHVTIRMEDEDRNKKAFEVTMFHRDEERVRDVVEKLTEIDNDKRRLRPTPQPQHGRRL